MSSMPVMLHPHHHLQQQVSAVGTDASSEHPSTQSLRDASQLAQRIALISSIKQQRLQASVTSTGSYSTAASGPDLRMRSGAGGEQSVATELADFRQPGVRR